MIVNCLIYGPVQIFLWGRKHLEKLDDDGQEQPPVKVDEEKRDFHGGEAKGYDGFSSK